MKKSILAACVLTAMLAGIGAYFLLPQPKPENAWLVFGPAAAVRVLVTMHGEAVTLDHYLEDKPTGRQERFPHRLECKDVPVRVPDDADNGMAKLTFSFNTWKEGKVASSRLELSIIEPAVAKSGTKD